MDGATRDPGAKESLRSPLVDVSDLPLAVVMALDESSVLGGALARLRAEAQDDSEIVAGHGASIA